MNQIQVGIIGATGYAGVELLRLLMAHPDVEIAAISSVSFEGKPVSEVYPSLYQINDTILADEDTVIAKSDVIFTSLPHGLCEKIAKKVTQQQKKMIDLGADFRLSEADYQQWYELDYQEQALHTQSCYCVPELHRERISQAVSIIGNPGCYPTSVALGIAPVIKAGFATLNGIVIDSKSGTTGAGRGLSQITHFPDCNEGFAAYKVAQHRHTPEIEQTISELAEIPVTVTFVPHLLPINRGILSTMYLPLNTGVTIEQVREAYQSAYQSESFVRVLPEGQTANLKQVKYSNYCDVSLHLDERTQTLIVLSAIDNMVKGAAGQAIQNMNLLFGLEETTGLMMIPPAI